MTESLAGRILMIHEDNFAEGTSVTYRINGDEWDACAGDKTCEKALQDRHRAEAIAEREAFWAERGVTGDIKFDDIWEVRRIAVQLAEMGESL